MLFDGRRCLLKPLITWWDFLSKHQCKRVISKHSQSTYHDTLKSTLSCGQTNTNTVVRESKRVVWIFLQNRRFFKGYLKAVSISVNVVIAWANIHHAQLIDLQQNLPRKSPWISHKFSYFLRKKLIVSKKPTKFDFFSTNYQRPFTTHNFLVSNVPSSFPNVTLGLLMLSISLKKKTNEKKFLMD